MDEMIGAGSDLRDGSLPLQDEASFAVCAVVTVIPMAGVA